MKKRIAYISLYFFTVLLIFILQKPLFMLYNGSIEKGFGFADYMQVMVHGASLDAATAGYLTAFPFLLVLISIWFRKFPLKKILYGYYILAAALISIIFVVDMALYTFWGFKLDASVFSLYRFTEGSFGECFRRIYLAEGSCHLVTHSPE